MKTAIILAYTLTGAALLPTMKRRLDESYGEEIFINTLDKTLSYTLIVALWPYALHRSTKWREKKSANTPTQPVYPE